VACGDKDDKDPTPTTAPAAGDAAGTCWTDAQRTADLAGKPQWSEAPAMIVDPAKTYTATIETSKGTITVDLLAKDAPVTVNNFVCLARAGFFDGIAFHRVVAGFVVQAGDPTGTGGKGPGYQFQDELPTTLNYERGTLAMANAGPNTNGSQFFICLDDLSQSLAKNYSIFGKVTAGMEAVDAIAAVPVQPGPSGEPSSPTEQVLITKVTITEA
jgi:cyclophilin family peptidyl-prolyl cis-trans isomerase